MLLKGSQRGYGSNLADHLSNDRENDHVDIDDIRGTAGQDLHSAFFEMEASANGTDCQQPFFHVKFNPPETANLTREQFYRAFEKLETDMDLKDHPRAVVFHEKKGREHAHVVYGRIYESLTYEHGPKAGQERPAPVIKAKQLDFHHLKLRRISQDLHREFGLEMPEGLKSEKHWYKESDPLNYNIQEWQQAERIGEDPRDLKKIIGDAFQYADNAASFNAALEQNAMQLARGDKRGFVVLHHSGEVLPLHRFLGVKQKNIRDRLGKPEHVQTIDQAKTALKDKMTAQAEKQVEDLKAKHSKEREPLKKAVQTMKQAHREERAKFKSVQIERQKLAEKTRADRIRSGIMGVWDRLQLRFEHGPLARQFREEIEEGRKRDLKEFHDLKTAQMGQRQKLQGDIRQLQERQRGEYEKARTVLAHWLNLDRQKLREQLTDHINELDEKKARYSQAREENRQQRTRQSERQNKRGKDRDPSLDL